ncbi:MAG: hypothetical protein UMS36scaffold28_16 [Phage 59_13]|nr:MAG: hypothetical protein UMS36scaffold28_16 [Phage 59_13]
MAEIKGTAQVIQNLSKIKKAIFVEIVAGAQAVQAKVINDARSLCPVFNGTLSQSIQPGEIVVTDANITAEVIAHANYASFVEFGTRPHFPPVDALRDWAARVLGDERLAFVVARAIARRGTYAKPFLGPALTANTATYKRAIIAGIKRGLAA